jgi:two-component system, OmpR family, sensor kinase
MQISFFNRLYVRIWLAVVVSLLVLTLAFGWLWRTHTDRLRAERLAEQPARELIVRDSAGQVIGQASAKAVRVPGQGLEFQVNMPDGKNLSIQLPPRSRAGADGVRTGIPPLPPPGADPARWLDNSLQRNPAFLLWLWGVVALAVALGSYPVVRRLTLRLEGLRKGVERWGAGDLRARVAIHGRDEVAFLGERFNAAADRIESLVQAHKSLLANTSHELRAPLARIRMGLELMETAPTTRLKAELARNINELDSLIEEILLSSRLDAAQHRSGVEIGKPEALDLLKIAQDECSQLGVPLHCQAPSLPMQGVPRLLRRLMRNLLENAQRHGGSGVEMHLRAIPTGMGGSKAVATPGASLTAQAAAGDTGAIEIEVCDRGPGVPEAEQQRIFEPFYRSQHASERDGGVGLGLSLVRSIAQSHQGSAHCYNRPGGGASFVAHLAGM